MITEGTEEGYIIQANHSGQYLKHQEYGMNPPYQWTLSIGEATVFESAEYIDEYTKDVGIRDYTIRQFYAGHTYILMEKR